MTGKSSEKSDQLAEPKVSIIIPVFNGQDSVEAAIDSILKQNPKQTEIIVINDGSTDRTGSICRQYEQRGKIVYLEQKNQGKSAARNHGLEFARGKYIAFLDADDLSAPGSIDKRAMILDNHPDVHMVFANVLVLDSAGKPPRNWIKNISVDSLKKISTPVSPKTYIISQDYLKTAFLDSCLLPSIMTVMVRKQVFQASGNFDETLPFAQDLEMWVRMAPFCNFAFIDENLAVYHFDSARGEREYGLKLSYRLRFLKKFRKGASWDLMVPLSVIIGRAHFELGLFLLKSGKIAQGLRHLTLGFISPHAYQRLFRPFRPLFLEGNPKPLFRDARRMAQYARQVLRIK